MGLGRVFLMAQGPAFFFCSFPLYLSPTGKGGLVLREARCFSAGKDGYFIPEGFSEQLPLATAAHNRPTQLSRGGFAASLASFPYSPPKTAHRAAQD